MECYFKMDKQLYSVADRGLCDRLSKYQLLSKNSASCSQMEA